jgi:YYY domain-containing protein
MLHALWWWLAVQIIALSATPLCLALFRPLADRGYGLSKAFGLLLFGYAVWLIAALQLLANGPAAYAAALALILGGSYLVWRRELRTGTGIAGGVLAYWRRRRGLILLQEAIFLVAFLGFLFIRSYNADIAGTEKFMDFAFMNAITRSTSFPPLDPWLAPSPAVPHPTINYYYFGYLIHGLLLSITRVPPAQGYNLALALVFALTAVGAFSLVYGLARDHVAERTARQIALPTGRRRSVAQLKSEPIDAPAGHEEPTSKRPVPAWSFKAARPYIAAGALGAYMLLISGNLWTALRRFDGSGLWQKDFWQGVGWNATRVLVIRQGDRDIDYTINEFPAFSFLLGDLHPHVLALPFAVLAVGLAYRWLMQPPLLFRHAVAGVPLPEGGSASQGTTWRDYWRRASPYAELLPGTMILGSLYFLNSWDFPAYFTLAVVAALGGAWWVRREHLASASVLTSLQDDEEPDDSRRGAEKRKAGGIAWGRTIAVIGLTGLLAIVLFLPFHLSFNPPVLADGAGLPLGLVLQRSLLSQFLQFWGVQLLVLGPVIVIALGYTGGLRLAQRTVSGSLVRARSTAIVMRESVGWEPAIAFAGLLAVALVAERAGAGVLVLTLALALAAGYLASRFLAFGGLDAGAVLPPVGGSHPSRPLAFAFGAICLAALLLAACEVVYIRDFYGGALRRMNTVFKLYYQAWLLFALGGSVAAVWVFRLLRSRRERPGGRLAYGAFTFLGVVLLGATMLFPYRVTLLRTNYFQNPSTLDGMDWMRRYHPEDYAAAQWLLANGPTAGNPAPVVVEATGGAYSEFARIATQTGFPTILGWDQHQRLWRGATINAEVDERKRDVDTLYGAATFAEVQPLLDKYGVTYIVVGYLEEQKYGTGGGLAKFSSAVQAGQLQLAFSQGKTAVYKRTT